MDIATAQREMRARFAGGLYGQAVSGALWLASAAVATWGTPRQAILLLVVGGFFIYPLTELIIRTVGSRLRLSGGNPLPELGMQVAFVLPLSMPLLVPVALYRLNWFYPAMMILVGAHSVPFAFLYGMRAFAGLAACLLGGGLFSAVYLSDSFSAGAWYTGVMLVAWGIAGRTLVARER